MGSSQPDTAARETTNQDAELRAMLAILKYLAPLDRDSIKRVLTWAEDRLVALKFAETMELDAPRKFFDALREASVQMGDVTPLDIIRAMEAISRAHDEATPSEEVVVRG